jgi:hypothetical protein
VQSCCALSGEGLLDGLTWLNAYVKWCKLLGTAECIWGWVKFCAQTVSSLIVVRLSVSWTEIETDFAFGKYSGLKLMKTDSHQVILQRKSLTKIGNS